MKKHNHFILYYYFNTCFPNFLIKKFNYVVISALIFHTTFSKSRCNSQKTFCKYEPNLSITRPVLDQFHDRGRQILEMCEGMERADKVDQLFRNLECVVKVCQMLWQDKQKECQILRKCAKSEKSLSKCAKSWGSMIKCAKSWRSIRKCLKVEKVWESVLKVEKIWESLLKVEKMCWKLRKHEKVC